MQVVCPGCRDPKQLVERGSTYFPFCSSRCQGTDLSGWVFEQYRVESGPPDPNTDYYDRS